MKKILAICAMIGLLCTPLAPMMIAAHAQAPGDTAVYGKATAPAITVTKGGAVIDVGQVFSEALQPWVNEIINALIIAGIGWFATWLRTRFKVELDAKQRDTLTAFLQNQASALIAAGAVKMNGTRVNVDNAVLAATVQRAAVLIPDAMKHFGLTPEVISHKIVEAIPQVTAGAMMVARAHSAEPQRAAETLP